MNLNRAARRSLGRALSRKRGRMRPDPTKALDVVLTNDPGLSDEMDLVAYIETRDPALIKDRDTARPAARFHLEPIPYEVLQHIENNTPTHLTAPKWLDALLFSLRWVRLPNGEKLEPKMRAFPIGSQRFQVAATDWAKTIHSRWGQLAVNALGRIAYDRACAPTEAGDGPL